MDRVVETPEAVEPKLRISDRSFRRLSVYIMENTGIKMSPAKITMVQSRLLRRVRELNLDSLEEYCERVFEASEDAEERIHLIDAITTNKTDFFREAEHFQVLRERILPELRTADRNQPMLVWSAACSSGEEPYTLAMVLAEFGNVHPEFDFRILATDLSTRVLETGRTAVYSRIQVRPVPVELRRRYLLQGKADGGARVRICPALRSRVAFHRLNLMDTDYGVREMFQVIFCRNVLIYFDRDTQQKVIGRLCRNLAPDGYLFISHSETLNGLKLPLRAVGPSCYRRCPS